MRYLLMTYTGPTHNAAWETGSVESKREEIAAVEAWFRQHGAAGRIVGGEELGHPHQARTVRLKGVTDGPFTETKELLGGFISVEVPDLETALEMARTWPGLRYDDDLVEVWPTGDTVADVDAQAAAQVS